MLFKKSLRKRIDQQQREIKLLRERIEVLESDDQILERHIRALHSKVRTVMEAGADLEQRIHVDPGVIDQMIERAKRTTEAKQEQGQVREYRVREPRRPEE